eukprot:COSAG01_NODE_385_length_17743_cov_20.528622_8_plen_59_part_00
MTPTKTALELYIQAPGGKLVWPPGTPEVTMSVIDSCLMKQLVLSVSLFSIGHIPSLAV